MRHHTRKSCPQCQRLQRQVDAQAARIKSLEAQVRQLNEKLAAALKDSSNSSKPPSSDIVKPTKPAGGGDPEKRKPGGQPGHPMYEREAFSPEEVTHAEWHLLHACPCCGGRLRRNGDLVTIVQQVDICRPPLTVEEHSFPEYWCERCRHTCKVPLPLHIQKGGLVGPHLTALIAYVKGVCHASFSTVRTFLRDVVGVTISRGQLVKIINKVSAALDQPYDELLKLLPSEENLNVDETGHKNNGDPWWTWCFRAELYALYRIDPHRNAEVLMETLGRDFAGVLGCDYFSAYRRFMRVCSVRLQFCLAHLIRDIKFLTTLPDARDRRYGEKLREAVKELFAGIHEQETLEPESSALRLRIARLKILHSGIEEAPPTRHGQNMAKRFRKHGDAYFTFLTTPGVEPTNNLAEQAIRFVVIDRHITQGTRSEGGRRWSERIWTAIATCAMQGRTVYEYLRDATAAWFANRPAPSLVG
ncbi:MAG: IS66 family transposase [Candidatus Acidiferrales bacterium]